jgi:ribonuclease HI
MYMYFPVDIKNDYNIYICVHNMSATSINVYIDGSCINNGKPSAKAGYAVYFGEDDARNEYKSVVGKQSNNTGELTAFIRCLEILQNDIQHNTTIHVYTDSEYVIKCASTYGNKLEKNGWQDKVPNKELVKRAHELYKNKSNIKLHYIKAHTDNTDMHSKGNSEADRFANLAVGCVKNNTSDIIKLDIGYFDKDKAKQLGACWNNERKYWYINSSKTSEENMKLLLEIQHTNTSQPSQTVQTTVSEKKNYVKIQYTDKEKAKRLGARWDYAVKSWYYLDSSISEENKHKLNTLSS